MYPHYMTLPFHRNETSPISEEMGQVGFNAPKFSIEMCRLDTNLAIEGLADAPGLKAAAAFLHSWDIAYVLNPSLTLCVALSHGRPLH